MVTQTNECTRTLSPKIPSILNPPIAALFKHIYISNPDVNQKRKNKKVSNLADRLSVLASLWLFGVDSVLL